MALYVGITSVLLMVAVCGVVLGIFVAKFWVNRSPSDSLASARIEHLIHSQLRWANALSGDLRQCHQKLADLERDVLESLCAGETPGLGWLTNVERDVLKSKDSQSSVSGMFVQWMSQMIQANGQMRQRLIAAEETLTQQTERVARSLSEARTDALTNLPNRRLFDEDLEQRTAALSRYGTNFTLLLFDIDCFKTFNDTYGHLAGDEILKAASHAIALALRESDLLARFGGEEFAVLLSQCDDCKSHVAAERARLAVANCVVHYGGQALRVTVSCGLAEARVGETPKELVRRSDAALYAAKNGGRDRVYCHDGQDCYPIVCESQLVQSATAAQLPHEAGSLRDACGALRARLLEVMSNSA